MEEKLPRLYRLEPYTTGDDQEWTYAYTWEDLETAINFMSSVVSDATHIQAMILHYFFDNPERITDEVREHISDTMLSYGKFIMGGVY